MITLGQVFASNNDIGVWTIAFPKDEYRDRPLFDSFDMYGGNVGMMVHSLTISGAQWNLFNFTDALLDFDLAGEWMAMKRSMGSRWSNDTSEMRFRFTNIEDADMFKMFGAPGTVNEATGIPGTIGFLDPGYPEDYERVKL